MLQGSNVWSQPQHIRTAVLKKLWADSIRRKLAKHSVQNLNIWLLYHLTSQEAYDFCFLSQEIHWSKFIHKTVCLLHTISSQNVCQNFSWHFPAHPYFMQVSYKNTCCSKAYTPWRTTLLTNCVNKLLMEVITVAQCSEIIDSHTQTPLFIVKQTATLTTPIQSEHYWP
jgi:hypothetical protein